MKKKLILILAVVLLLAGAGSTYAYLTRTLKENNSFTTGYCDIRVNETGSIPVDIPAGKDFSITDTVTVTNTGTYPCYVRAVIDFDSYISEAASTIKGTDSKWIKDDSDGFYYYSSILNASSESDALMTGIDVAALEDEEAESYRIGIYFEAIDAVNESDYESAWSNFLGGSQ